MVVLTNDDGVIKTCELRLCFTIFENAIFEQYSAAFQLICDNAIAVTVIIIIFYSRATHESRRPQKRASCV